MRADTHPLEKHHEDQAHASRSRRIRTQVGVQLVREEMLGEPFEDVAVAVVDQPLAIVVSATLGEVHDRMHLQPFQGWTSFHQEGRYEHARVVQADVVDLLYRGSLGPRREAVATGDAANRITCVSADGEVAV